MPFSDTILQGLIIIISNTGIMIIGARLLSRDRKRIMSSPAGLMQRRRIIEERARDTIANIIHKPGTRGRIVWDD